LTNISAQAYVTIFAFPITSDVGDSARSGLAKSCRKSLSNQFSCAAGQGAAQRSALEKTSETERTGNCLHQALFQAV